MSASPARQSATPPAPGVFAPVPTFFQASTTGSTSHPALDMATQVSHAVHLARSGCTGLVLLGSTGESVHLTNAERSTIVTSVRSGLCTSGFPRSYPLIVGTATNSIADTLDQLQASHAAGADYGLVLAPGYFAAAVAAVDQDGLKRWYTAVADASSIPVLLYNYPAVSNGVFLTAPTVRALSAHPNIVGCKFSHSDVSTHSLVTADSHVADNNFRVYTGLGQQLISVMVMGAAGAIDALANVCPRAMMKLWELAGTVARGEGGKEVMEEARELQFVVCKAEELVGKWGIVGIKEALERMAGFGAPKVGRSPLRNGMDESEWASCMEIMEGVWDVEVRLGGGKVGAKAEIGRA